MTELITAFSVKEEGQEFISKFMRENNVTWCKYQPRTFEGNMDQDFKAS